MELYDFMINLYQEYQILHNDLYMGNIIYNEYEHKMTLIDWGFVSVGGDENYDSIYLQSDLKNILFCGMFSLENRVLLYQSGFIKNIYEISVNSFDFSIKKLNFFIFFLI